MMVQLDTYSESMKKARRVALPWACVTLSVLLEVLFYSLSSEYNIIFWLGTSLLAVASFIFCFSSKRFAMHSSSFLNCYLVALVGFVLLQLVYTSLFFGQSMSDFARAGYFYSFVLLVFPLIYLLNADGGYEKVLNIILVAVSASSLAHLLNTVLLNMGEAGFLSVTLSTRLGSARVYTLSTLSDLMILYSFFMLLKKNTNVRFLFAFAFLLCFAAEVYVRQSRVEVAILIVAVLFIWASFRRGSRISAYVCLVLLFVLVAALASNAIEAFIDSFSPTGKMGFSTINRINEISYYWEEFTESPLCGIGVLNGHSNTQWFHLLHGDAGLFWSCDVGIIGVLGDIGISAIVLYVIPVVRMLAISVKYCKGEHDDSPFAAGVIIFVVLASATMIPFTKDTILAWPFFLALFEFWNNKRRDCTEK